MTKRDLVGHEQFQDLVVLFDSVGARGLCRSRCGPDDPRPGVLHLHPRCRGANSRILQHSVAIPGAGCGLARGSGHRSGSRRQLIPVPGTLVRIETLGAVDGDRRRYCPTDPADGLAQSRPVASGGARGGLQFVDFVRRRTRGRGRARAGCGQRRGGVLRVDCRGVR